MKFPTSCMLKLASAGGISLDAAGLVALADLKTIVYRTALTGSASYLDTLVLAPGIHLQQSASDVNGGEYPTTAAMTTGYVFRVENQATVSWLQRIGRSGHLATVYVSPPSRTDTLASVSYLACITSTIAAVTFLWSIQDLWALGVLSLLMFARLLNVAVIKRRTELGWKGAPEPGVRGDLIILLSQDRWVRMQGMVDDIKVVTSGNWLRELTDFESFVVGLATVLVYASAGLAGNASMVGSVVVAGLLLSSVCLLGLCNMATSRLQMFGREIRMDGKPKAYTRRLEMTMELIAETGREDWAIALGMIVPSAEKLQKVTP